MTGTPPKVDLFSSWLMEEWDEELHPRGPDGKFIAGGGGGAASFDRDTWAAKGFRERREQWGKLSVRERDQLADAPQAVRRVQEERLASYGRRPSFGEYRNTSEAVGARVSQCAGAVSGSSAELITAEGQRLVDLLTLAGADERATFELAMEATDSLLVQENEAMGRTLGDHGIHHVEGDLRMALDAVAAAPGVDTSLDKAVLSVASIFHDTGYLTEPSQLFLDEGHPRWSAQHFEENLRPLVEDALGSRAADDISHLVRTHADTSMDWQEEPVASAMRLADNLALFHEEKLPPLFRDVPGTLDTLARYHSGSLDFPTAQAEMRAALEASDLFGPAKESASRAIAELSPVTPKMTLGMLGGRVAGIEWEEDHPLVHLERNRSQDAAQRVLDLGQAQFAKFARTYGANPEQFSRDLSFEFKDASGQTLLRALQESLRMLLSAYSPEVLLAEWDEEDHPRVPGGESGGGQFTSAGGSGGGGGNDPEALQREISRFNADKRTRVTTNLSDVLEVNAKGVMTYAGTHQDDWDDWAIDPEPFQAGAKGEPLPRMWSGDVLTDEDKEHMAQVGKQIQQAADSYKVPWTKGFRGESYETKEEVASRYAVGTTLALDKITSITDGVPAAENYAKSEAALSVPVVLAFGDPKGIDGIQTCTWAGVGSEAVMPMGRQWQVTVSRWDEEKGYWLVGLGALDSSSNPVVGVDGGLGWQSKIKGVSYLPKEKKGG